jgi:phosphatidylglycerol lysyltransferase
MGRSAGQSADHDDPSTVEKGGQRPIRLGSKQYFRHDSIKRLRSDVVPIGFRVHYKYMAEDFAGRDNYKRARDLVMRFGWNTTCFQIVNPGIEYWFGDEGNSVVGFVSSAGVRVVAGAPVCSKEDLPAVTESFESDSASRGLGVCYFGAEARLESVLRDEPNHASVLLGAQPVWHPAEWAAIVAANSSIRSQVNRARNKGVVVTEWPIERAHDSPRLRDCLESWLSSKGLPPLHFVIEPETLTRLENRRVLVAERGSTVEAFLVLSPIPQRSGWLTEQFPHRPGAPNGTVELMMDQAFRLLASEGCEYITLGLSPLSRRAKIEPFDNPLWLRGLLAWLRKHGQRFYNFDGLDRFKAKLRPERWEPVFAIANEPDFSGRTLYAIAAAFTENHPFRVLAGGLRKAMLTEVKTFSKWVTRTSSPGK